MKKVFFLSLPVIVMLFFSLTTLEAPSSGTVWGTTWGKLESLTTNLNLISAADSETAPGLRIALKVHLIKMGSDIQTFSAVNIAGLSDEEVVSYAQAVCALNDALRSASSTLNALGYSDLSSIADSNLNSLISVVSVQMTSNPAFNNIVVSISGETKWRLN